MKVNVLSEKLSATGLIALKFVLVVKNYKEDNLIQLEQNLRQKGEKIKVLYSSYICRTRTIFGGTTNFYYSC